MSGQLCKGVLDRIPAIQNEEEDRGAVLGDESLTGTSDKMSEKVADGWRLSVTCPS